MTNKISGGCACGDIRYECSADPAFVAHCHCKDCQKASGGQMGTFVAVPKAAFKLLAGKTKSFAYIGDSGKPLQRHFCGRCGSRLFADAEILPDMLFVSIGSVDKADWLEPSMHIYTDSAQPWAHIPEGATKFAKMPA